MDFDRAYNKVRYGYPRIQYNKVFKAEYLPSRVRYNQFFALALVGGLVVSNSKSSVSIQATQKVVHQVCCLTKVYHFIVSGVSRIRARLI